MIKTDGIVKRNSIFKMIDYLWSIFATLSVIFLMLGAWEFGSKMLGEFILPSPLVVLQKVYEILKDYAKHDILITIERMIIGIGVSSLAGIFLGLIAGSSKTMRVLLKPFITFLLTMPPIIWVVLAFIWFGFGDFSTIFTIIITVLPLTFSSSMMGMASVDSDLEEVFSLYKLGIYKKIWYFYIPQLISYIISSLSIAIGMGAKIVVMTELLSATNGIGARIADARSLLEMDAVLAYVCIIIAFIALIEYLLIKPLEILLMPWRR
ncbi:ABC transporter permease [Campylobacter hyointestinalis]|uniref:ABC transporter permease subunit n=1 Tax=Campylobacter hyointestinalis subsp. lawsonii TaxID=91353 RepID=A0AAV6EJ93_CAMHY|nr:ABC transporter permease subunit [Campylobacter hyointestinalis]KAB0614459.1 ABC transporter permease subunit [Campylobacter hyointestinalis subsp. lawsonii]QKF70211.1 nitrate/sulfonate/bicarbonate ABC transporter, permease protein [Campylobacter hyointestinalis subsp. lawsonii]RAZ27150.1 ABC transporter permease [Campylobacter hyointestinalis subsp. lawsonii]RAZ48948.1 ABC transporter permease [Campylobacter hyointestinalis subsp. lawsonii]RAZ50975.1 ABC transporter permease [Campylobacter